MKNVNLVRIRWQKGTERINVEKNDTIGRLINYMGKKYEFPTDGLTLLQESTKTVLQPKVKLATLQIENGELFRLDLPIKKIVSDDSKDFTQKEFRPTTAKKEGWSENVVTLDQMKALHPTLLFKKATESAIKRVLFPEKNLYHMGHVCKALHYNATRVFLCYGTRPSKESIRVHCVSMPSQEFNGKKLVINNAMKKTSDNVAMMLGLELVGAAVLSPPKTPIFAPNIYLDIKEILGIDLKMAILLKIVPSIASLSSDGKKVPPCTLEAFTLSEQFVTLFEEGLFTGEVKGNALITKERIAAGGEITNEADVAFFTTPTAIKSRDSWFPRARFPYQAFYPTVADFVSMMEKDFEAPNFIRLLDFNLLIWMENLFSRDLPLICRKCIAKEVMPDNVLVRMEETVEPGLRNLIK